MALVTFSGYPCSGKSTRASELVRHLSDALTRSDYDGTRYAVTVVSDESLNLARSVYNGGYCIVFVLPRVLKACSWEPAASVKEKPARQALFTSVQRLLSKNTILVVDAPNYIKGFRYQMFCAAKEAGVRICTVRFVCPAVSSMAH